ncbi:rhomboid family intramembrane serine protease [Donghicola eburneus]|uniref:rhomboid family intramembrane serine protease n=1 Tax=Donghicola eburneus TaxID=393278 RepID=UPI000933C20F|nr:rhomboid family intramembrane serine protease [Donghicola eburneus]
MFPIRDQNPSRQVPYVTYALITANVLAFFSHWPLLVSDAELQRVYVEYAMFPVLIVHGEHLYTLFTSMFMHGSFMHIAGNMLFLYIFGDNMEEQFGRGRYLLFYLASGLVAAVFQIAAEPFSSVPMVGASGAIAGVMGGYLLLFPKARVDILLILIIIWRVVTVPAWLMLGLWFAFQLFGGLGTPTDEGGVAYWAHIGGFVAGIALTWPLWRRKGGRRFWDRQIGLRSIQRDYTWHRTQVPRVRRR